MNELFSLIDKIYPSWVTIICGSWLILGWFSLLGSLTEGFLRSLLIILSFISGHALLIFGIIGYKIPGFLALTTFIIGLKILGYAAHSRF